VLLQRGDVRSSSSTVTWLADRLKTGKAKAKAAVS